ncbi:MAG: flagellar filament capping protein FliD [Lachnospiraceae bacterium]|nr:flagellar filament capping protein FliD [Lachnospiraceae bacterium]
MGNINISALFGGLKSNTGFESINLSDYSMLRSGAYKKLVKSYYALDKKDAASKKDKTKENKVLDPLDKTGLTKMKTEAEGLKSATQAIGKTELWTENNRENIVSAVKKYVSEYNDVISQSAKTTSKGVAQNVQFMSGMTNAMTKALSKIGVSVGMDGKLSVDEETLNNVDTNNIKSLFSGSSSYGAQIEKYASGVASSAVKDASVYNSNGNLNSSFSSMFNKWI